ncbi:PREDICTED: L10-interacting MYB domain-containing protein [Tarenaya hassleriana]|uniref:L10-interacting MYB domain-containing protein n=1 Tax=Tarenaya hassleriana TaxID=28532 RepID=UPI00053C890F|nr:PREDICTED: L10-interacting MYB domain-containing protein [Tarenaya hassleriana]XP_010548575.1 PREDICTED: L10-interacting MYB domain-containing protein [Tarenaya hassleriana]XP_019058836.1 PREDICTED: L10-interacting MYB domain-containing protein [Tarenaya hassleriana]
MSGQASSNDRTRTYWTPSMERFFIDLMLEHMHRGNRIGHTFNKQAWNEMINVFNVKFGSQYDKDVLKSRYTNLWKQYNSVKNLLGHDGFSWDENQQMVIGDENVWSAYIKVHPEARVYKTKAVLNFNDLCLIYGYTVADGRYSRSSHDIDFEDEFQGVNMGESSINTNDCPRTEWTPVMDQYFIELMLDQIGRRNKTGDAFSKQAWTDMLVLFNARFGAQYGKRVLRHRYNKLLKYYKDMKVIVSKDGFSWDETLQMIAADDDVWDSYIKEHPHARTYRMRTLPNYNDLEIIFGNPTDQGILPHPVLSKELIDDSSAAKTDERKTIQTKNSDRTRTFWTPPMDRYLIDLLVDQVHKGNKVGQTFITSGWIEMVTAFNAKFGSLHNKDVLKNRFKHLRRLYNDITFLLQQNGFLWDARRDMVIAEDSIWDTYIQAHPEARSYRVKMVPSYQKMCLIFGKEMPDRRYTHLAQAFEPNIAEAVTMTGDEKNDYLCGSMDPPCTEWTQVMDRCLIDLMLEQVNSGNKIGETFTEQAWADMVESFSKKFGIQTDIYILENRYIYLMKERDDINNILSHCDFSWDENKQTIVADGDESWESYIKEHPDAIMYRGKLLGDCYRDLCKISEPLSQESFDCENIMIEMENFDEVMEMGDANLPRKRTNSTASLFGHAQKVPRTGTDAEEKPFSEAEGLSGIGNAIDALQALPDMDDELLLDACDLLEDERKAKTFLALDVSLRKKWLLRKLRPLSDF